MYSSTEDQAGMPGLIAQYIEHARQVAEQLQRADEADELHRARALCLDLKGSAPGVGGASAGASLGGASAGFSSAAWRAAASSSEGT